MKVSPRLIIFSKKAARDKWVHFINHMGILKVEGNGETNVSDHKGFMQGQMSKCISNYFYRYGKKTEVAQCF